MRRRFPRWVWWTGGSTLCLIAAPLSYVLAIPRVSLISQTEIEKLRALPRVALPSEPVPLLDNAYPLLLEAGKSYNEKAFSSLLFDQPPTANAEASYIKAREANVLLQRALLKSRVQVPASEQDAFGKSFRSGRHILNVRIDHARELLAKGREDEGTRHLIMALKCADHLRSLGLSKGEEGIKMRIGCHVYDAMHKKQIGAASLRRILSVYATNGLSEAAAVDRIRGWYNSSFAQAAAYRGSPKVAGHGVTQSLMAAGRFDQAATLKKLKRILPEVVRSFTVPLAESRVILNRAFGHSRRVYEQGKGYVTGKKNEAEKLRDRMLLSLIPNLAGETIIYERMRHGLYLNNYVSEETILSAVRLLMALGIYRQEKGRYPNDLDALVREGLLSEVPKSWFTGKRFSYDAKRKLFWTPGADLVDRGGQIYKGEWTPPKYPDKWPTWYLDHEMTWQLP